MSATLDVADASAASATASNGLYRLKPAAQDYAWGRPAAYSEARRRTISVVAFVNIQPLTNNRHQCPHLPSLMQVAKLMQAAGFEIDPAKPYAELWQVSFLDALSCPHLALTAHINKCKAQARRGFPITYARLSNVPPPHVSFPAGWAPTPLPPPPSPTTATSSC
jgi:hypothetical protein